MLLAMITSVSFRKRYSDYIVMDFLRRIDNWQ
jgi:hypothetical protein